LIDLRIVIFIFVTYLLICEKKTQIQHLSGARLVEQRAPALLKQWTLDNVITLTSDDSRNIGDVSRNSMDVSRTCANRTLRESSVNPKKEHGNIKLVFMIFGQCPRNETFIVGVSALPRHHRLSSDAPVLQQLRPSFSGQCLILRNCRTSRRCRRRPVCGKCLKMHFFSRSVPQCQSSDFVKWDN